VRRVDGQRRYNREDELSELLVQKLPIFVVECRVITEDDSLAGKCRRNLGEEPLRDLLILGFRLLLDRSELLCRCQPIRGRRTQSV